MRDRHDPEGSRLPIKIDTTTNGEYAPIPLSPPNREANRLAHARADELSRRLDLDRRRFLVTLCGAASSLMAMNLANAQVGRTGGYFALAEEADLDADAAAESLADREFIFDVQGHYVPPSQADARKAACAAHPHLSREYMRCLGADDFIKDVFLDADTDMMVLSFVPSARDDEPLTIAEADATRRIIDEMEGTHRLLIHGRVNPNQAGDLDGMDELAETYGVSAWKTYTQWGPDGKGFWMTDDVGIAFVEKARALGVKNICIHKGIPFGRRSYQHSLCTDIGRIAKRYPDVNFLIYHSGYIPGQAEGAYDPARGEGVDELIRSVVEEGVVDQGNVYAELGSTWRQLMQDPDSAAHTIGKLVKHLGPDNVLWGTDSIWYGSPQDQIQAFRSFQISQEFQERYGYRAMDADLRAKIFGLNATRPYGISAEEVMQRTKADPIEARRVAYREDPDPHFLTRGPKTRREFLELMKLTGGGPG